MGEVTKTSRTELVKASLRSVSMFIFAIPKEMAFFMCASGIPLAPLNSAPYFVAFSTIHEGTPEAPCKTSGMLTLLLMAFYLPTPIRLRPDVFRLACRS